ncbi:DUF305 domain-containing protein [Rufibacter immobilis]|uniref:DUF305 domain-containing protein n=1 Tax=Rufibacter immobilis TaxID=1348778 RepID=A0A3M9N1Y4_9BACT|nr:DUF305 domain-containing protein [Rufibacter immobilis]RNI31812.1 DUF305 domain-containing protein [Rufibacter immobilis]
MKNNKFNSKWVALLCGASLFFTACSQNSGNSDVASDMERTEDHSGHNMEAGESNEMMDLMHENMTAMQEVKLTGNPDVDFANLMATHHEGAIKMAQEEESKGSDTMLVNMAKKSPPKQKEEQEKLRDFVQNNKSATGDTAATRKMMQPMKSMMANMNHNMAGTTDHHFASLMSMHHQSGIDMVKVYLSQAKAPEIKAMAQKIMDEQQKEKQELDAWLQKHPQ